MGEFEHIMEALDEGDASQAPRKVAYVLAFVFLDQHNLTRFNVDIQADKRLLKVALGFSEPYRAFEIEYQPLQGFKLYLVSWAATTYRLEPPETFLKIEDLVKRINSSKHRPSCRHCGREGIRNDRYDAYYCVDCKRWLEEGCGQATCEICSKRPAKPPLEAPPV